MYAYHLCDMIHQVQGRPENLTSSKLRRCHACYCGPQNSMARTLFKISVLGFLFCFLEARVEGIYHQSYPLHQTWGNFHCLFPLILYMAYAQVLSFPLLFRLHKQNVPLKKVGTCVIDCDSIIFHCHAVKGVQCLVLLQDSSMELFKLVKKILTVKNIINRGLIC